MTRHRMIRTAGAAGAFLALALCGSPGRAASPTVALAVADDAGSLALGRTIVQRNCGMCHATGREGLSPNPQAPLFRELHKRYDVEELAEALAEGILTGHPAMPQFRFEPREINSIIRYLKSIQTDQRAGVSPAPAPIEVDAPKGS